MLLHSQTMCLLCLSLKFRFGFMPFASCFRIPCGRSWRRTEMRTMITSSQSNAWYVEDTKTLWLESVIWEEEYGGVKPTCCSTTCTQRHPVPQCRVALSVHPWLVLLANSLAIGWYAVNSLAIGGLAVNSLAIGWHYYILVPVLVFLECSISWFVLTGWLWVRSTSVPSLCQILKWRLECRYNWWIWNWCYCYTESESNYTFS